MLLQTYTYTYYYGFPIMFQYSASEQNVMKTRLETERYGLDITDDERPNSKLYKYVTLPTNSRVNKVMVELKLAVE